MMSWNDVNSRVSKNLFSARRVISASAAQDLPPPLLGTVVAVEVAPHAQSASATRMASPRVALCPLGHSSPFVLVAAYSTVTGTPFVIARPPM